MSAIAIYSAEPLHVDGLRYVLQRFTALQIAPTVQTVDELLQTVIHRRGELALVLIDYAFGGLGTLQGVVAAKGGAEKPHVALWAREIPPEIALQALRLGCKGVVRQTLGGEVQARAIERIVAGEPWWEKGLTAEVLSAQERSKRITRKEGQVIAMLCHGMRNKAIGEVLFCTEGTIKVYLHRLFRKLGVKTRHELAMWGRANGYDQTLAAPPRFIVPPGRAA